MKICRFERAGQVSFGRLADGNIHPITGDIFGEHEFGSEMIPIEDVRLLAPMRPPKILAIGLNYRSHVGDRPELPEPGVFLKPPTAVIGPEDAIVTPRGASPVHFEGELVAVIGRRARHISREQALDYVYGYMCGNDVSERQWQQNDLQWFRAKGSDTFAALGPWIVTDIEDPSKLELETRLNGEVVQHSPTDLMINDVPRCIAYLSDFVTLEPGDVIYTGTPGQTRGMNPGDIVEVEISRIGVLRNRVTAEE